MRIREEQREQTHLKNVPPIPEMFHEWLESFRGFLPFVGWFTGCAWVCGACACARDRDWSRESVASGGKEGKKKVLACQFGLERSGEAGERLVGDRDTNGIGN